MGRTLAVTHTIAGVSRASGGPSYSVPALSDALSRLGAKVTLRTLAADREQIATESYALSVHPKSCGLLTNPYRMSRSLRAAIAEDSVQGAIVHCHGLWLMPNIYPAWARRRSNGSSRLVHSPRGMLGAEALRIGAWKKRPFWWMLQRSALSTADCLHATAVSEYDEIRAAGLRKPVAVIPNGIDLPSLEGVPQAHPRERTVLSLGRVHPKKALDRLIMAWAALEPSHPNWHLRIIGQAEGGHDEQLRALARSLGTRNVTIEGPLFGNDKLQAYRSSDVFVLPTLNENFAMVVAEALAAEIPVISTKGAPWAGLETEGCGWWSDHGVEALTAVMGKAMDLPRCELHAMGVRGRAWMARDFGWEPIASDMLNVYRWLKNGGSPPPTVRIN